MDNSQYNTYRNNINKRDNDIFNRSSALSRRDTRIDTNHSQYLLESRSQCNTPYNYKSNEADLNNINTNPFINNLTVGKPENNRKKSMYGGLKTSYSSNYINNRNNQMNNKIITSNKKKSKFSDVNRSENNFRTFYDENKYLPNKSIGRIETDDDLICNNCFNKSMTNFKETNKRYRNKSTNDGHNNDPFLFSQTQNSLFRNRIEGKIQSRQTFTDKASRSIEKYKNNQKESLQKEYETQSNFFDKNVDYVLERAKERNRLNESLVSKSLDQYNNENPQKAKYFRSYVDNAQPYNSKPYSSISSDPEFKKKYSNELKHQIILRSEAERKRKEKEMQIEKERIEKSKIEEAKAEKEKRDKVRSLNDSFIYTNLKLMNDKKRKENSERIKEFKISQEYHDKNMEILNFESRQAEAKKNNLRQSVQEALDNQINEKKRKKEEELKSSKKPSNSNGFIFSCDHGNNLYPCAICYKPYPKRNMSPNIFKRNVAKFLNCE